MLYPVELQMRAVSFFKRDCKNRKKLLFCYKKLKLLNRRRYRFKIWQAAGIFQHLGINNLLVLIYYKSSTLCNAFQTKKGIIYSPISRSNFLVKIRKQLELVTILF